MASTTYSCTALFGTNKAGRLKCDADGYYDVVLGALDYWNSAGAFYAFNTAKKLFEDSSALQRRVAKGVLRGELGHPKKLPGMSDRQYLMRILEIDEKCVSHHIKEVTIDQQNVKDKNGNAIIAIMGRVKPAGPFAEALAASFENPNENTCFSIRSITDDVIDKAGNRIKNLIEIVTWDCVNEPGLQIANKYDCPSLENMMNTKLSPDLLIAAKNMAMAHGVGLESERVQSIDRVLAYVNAIEGERRSPAGLILPASAKW